jgi:hypothetical protein
MTEWEYTDLTLTGAREWKAKVEIHNYQITINWNKESILDHLILQICKK